MAEDINQQARTWAERLDEEAEAPTWPPRTVAEARVIADALGYTPAAEPHDVKYHHGGEVVCTCGQYFASDRFSSGFTTAMSALQKYAEHVRVSHEEQ